MHPDLLIYLRHLPHAKPAIHPDAMHPTVYTYTAFMLSCELPNQADTLPQVLPAG